MDQITTAKACSSALYLLLLISGFIALIMGIWDKSDISPYSALVHEDYQILLLITTFTIVAGVLAIFFSAFGCLSTILGNRYLIMAVGILLCFLVLSQIAITTVFLLMTQDETLLELKSEVILGKLFSRYYNDTTNATRRKTDFIQQSIDTLKPVNPLNELFGPSRTIINLKCCGQREENPYGSNYPDSCKEPHSLRNYSQPCQKQLTNKLIKSTKKLSRVLLVLTAFEIIGLLGITYMAKITNG